MHVLYHAPPYLLLHVCACKMLARCFASCSESVCNLSCGFVPIPNFLNVCRVSPRTRQRASAEEASSSHKKSQPSSVQSRKGLNIAPLELASKNSEPAKVDGRAMFDKNDDEDDDHDEEEEEEDEDDDDKKGAHVRGCRCGRSKCLKQYCQCFR